MVMEALAPPRACASAGCLTLDVFGALVVVVEFAGLTVAGLRERMTKAAEGKQAINMFDTKDNADRLARATKA